MCLKRQLYVPFLLMATLSISPIRTPFRSIAFDEISTPPISPRTHSPIQTQPRRHTYLAEYCYECDREFNFLRVDEYVLDDHVFCSRRCMNRFQNALCYICECHSCSCEDDASTLSSADEVSDSEAEAEADDGYPDLNIAFIDEDDTEDEFDYEDDEESADEDESEQIAPWRP